MSGIFRFLLLLKKKFGIEKSIILLSDEQLNYSYIISKVLNLPEINQGNFFLI